MAEQVVQVPGDSVSGALRAGFEYYRALERTAEDNARRAGEYRVGIPVLALGGAAGWDRGDQVAELVRRFRAHLATRF
ncbi:hypothetical protein [Amycolatopsis sp. 3B14]|uniref:hypothetical protein n=1 Tax=Amycolatopsis sp. 3B14 TaxID=3243600 RepID=UPI003D97E4ED